MSSIPPIRPAAKKPHRDSLRELVETVVFVVVLVLVLKLFVVEAFVIPTGSMAETLLGYHKTVECEQCGYKFPVNSSEEVEGRKGVKKPIVGYRCPNCEFPGKSLPPSDSGDRVLVHKAMAIDHRGSVVVFKFPEKPQLDHVAQNYIKRLVGFGGETIAIFHGKLFVHKSLAYPAELYPLPDDPKILWDLRYTYSASPTAMDAFESAKARGFPADGTGFELIRKPDDQVLAMRRLVYHNDFQAKDLLVQPPRWTTSGEGWGAPGQGQTAYSHTGAGRGFLKYQHLRAKNSDRMRDREKLPKAQLITNVMGYNTGSTGSFRDASVSDENADDNTNWVGDLHVECTAKIDGPEAGVILDLGRGPNRYQAHFANGTVKLVRTGPGGKVLAERPTKMTGAGKFELRFANVDCRLRVWVDDKAIDFGTDADYPFEAPSTYDKDDAAAEGWTKANDLDEPAAIEVTGGVTLSTIVLWRDTFYTHTDNHKILHNRKQPSEPPEKFAETFHVQPGHFLCFGDNSSQSYDGRGWGQVPERLMLGRAVFTFWPAKRIGFIR